jgi:hypothetical protein
MKIVVTAKPVLQIVRSGIWCSKKGQINVIVPEYVTSGV